MADESGPARPAAGEEPADAEFDRLVAEAAAAPVEGWDFSWFEGRATEERPPWGYQRLIRDRLSRADSALDLQTGGGEVLAGAAPLPRTTAATEGWPPNAAEAAGRLHPLGAVVVMHPDGAPLPFPDGAFDLVLARHPVSADWPEAARVLAPGGTYLSQEVGPASVFELVEYFLGPQPPEVRGRRDPEHARQAAEAAGLEVTGLRTADLAVEFFDIGAVVHFLRKVVWMVPGFSADAYRGPLRALHAQIARDGAFRATATRFLIEARRPG
ncbi:class I SAM-dependent methyltransferase [Nocardiopsis coralliicola]